MSKSQRLRESDYRVIFRILSDLRELRHNQPALQKHLVDSLCKMAGATGGFTAEIENWSVDQTIQISSFTPSQTGLEVVVDALATVARNGNFWEDPSFTIGVKHTGDVEALAFHQMTAGYNWASEFPLFAELPSTFSYVDHLIGWHQRRPARGNVRGISLHRYGQGEKLFGNREVAAVQFFLAELHWIEQSGRLVPVGPATDQLPPRLRQVLNYLLAGDSPKQIALATNLKVSSVRDHIKRLYRALGVNGRDELWAKFRRD